MNCPKCGSAHVSHRGIRHNKQRYQCQKCYKYFVGDKIHTFNLSENIRVLVFDIETLPIVAYTWGTWNVNINKEQIIKDWAVLSWSAKWLNDIHMITDCLTPQEALDRDDKRITQSLWNLLDKANVVIVQNGRKFDIPKMNARFWKYEFPQPSSYKVIDTCDAAKRAFGMTYNSLDYLGEYLRIGRKIKTEFQLWVDCDLGDKKAIKIMQEYNEGDVLLLEDVYNKMKAWIPGHPKFTLYDKMFDKCPVCFGEYEEIGVYSATQKQYKEYRCLECGVVFHDTKCIK
jgi:predicted RNA-binding Zn-ribbon protein involved in translation (DUF1610 family)